MNYLTEIAKVQRELEDRTYRTRPVSEFIVTERGKTRTISGEEIRDRVVRHSLCDNVLMPELRRYLIYDNGASLEGKGIDFARRRIVTHLRKYYRQHGNEGYILLIDFSKYYDNIRHETLYNEIARHIHDEYALWLLHEILDDFKVDVSYMSNEEYARCMETKFDSLAYRHDHTKSEFTGEKYMRKSLQIGDQVSQIAGIYYPMRIDNYVKIVCGEKYYARYMDDSYIISPTKEHLHEMLDCIEKIAGELGITINRKKTHIAKLSQTFRFLQIGYQLTDTGRVVQKINPKRVTAMRRKLKKLAGKIPDGDITQMYRSWIGTHYKYMSNIQRKSLNELYHSLIPSKEVKGNE